MWYLIVAVLGFVGGYLVGGNNPPKRVKDDIVAKAKDVINKI